MTNFHRTAFLTVLLVISGLRLAPAAAQDATELLLRLDRLEASNRSLTGQLEQTQNQVRRLEDQLKRFQADVDFRFQDGKGAARATPAPGGASPPGTGKRSDAFDSSNQPAVSGAPQPLGGQTATIQPLPGGPSIPGNGIVAEERTPRPQRGPGEPLPIGGPPVGARVPGVPGPVVAAVPGASAQDDLTLARGFLQRGDYELAEGQFREFMRTYPKDRLASEAMFGLAETYFLRQRYQEAAEQYLNLSTQQPQAGRAPEALLKLAMSLRAIGERDQACGTLGEVGRKYPRASASVKQAVEREQKRSRC